MALYLGNQKVSLRSGQDPTFDYGFDSNGRLVFANKNATEINNFLNYDSSYSEVLNLSNLNKMEKVAVNGTADRKMEGLKGLLVSPNAPFTGSSPQINASYTGLDKAALVNLFKSMPYNVGYTVVGSPTIVDGVVSGFSGSDYLQLNSNIPLDVKILEIYSKITTPAVWHTGGFIGTILARTTWEANGLTLSDNHKLQGKIKTGSTMYTIVTNEALSVNTTYYVKYVYNKNTGKLSIGFSTDNQNWIEAERNDISSEGVLVSGGSYRIGQGSFGYFRGSIDLNHTYIKVNGVPWFTGKAAMTKTCSIVGCTGTAGLTQEDKNIILNKGWSLTVQ